MLEMTLEETKQEIAILRGLMEASSDFSPASMSSIGGLCGLIKEACRWKKDNRAFRMTLLRIITGIPKLTSTKQLTQTTVNTMIDQWLVADHESRGWHPNEKTKQFFALLTTNLEAFAILETLPVSDDPEIIPF